MSPEVLLKKEKTINYSKKDKDIPEEKLKQY